MKITRIEATPVNIGFGEPEAWSQGRRTAVTAIVVEIHTDAGLRGVGESIPAPTPDVTLSAIESSKENLVGRDPRRVGEIWHSLQQMGWSAFPYVGNGALAGIEIACWDILGKDSGAPVWQLLGGRARSRVDVMGFVQNGNSSEMESKARDMAGRGYRTLYTKVGLAASSDASASADLAAAAALRTGGGPDVQVRVDPNEAWTPGDALRFAYAAQHLDLQYIEQPVRADMLSELRLLRERSPVPIAANQSSWTNRQLFDILAGSAADVVMTDPWQAGGISNFQRAVHLCEVAGIPLVYHSFAPLSIATMAAIQVLAISPACGYAHQTYNHLLVDDVASSPVHIKDGSIAVYDQPGIGVTIDSAKLAEYHEAYLRDGYASPYSVNWIGH